MSIQSVAAFAVRTPQPSVQDAPAASKSAPSTPASAIPAQRPDSVTLSTNAKLAAATRQQTSPTSDAGAARSAVVRAAASHASVPQTTTSGYAMKVRAALARGGNQSVSQVMAALGIPQAEQQQVVAALGAPPKSAS